MFTLVKSKMISRRRIMVQPKRREKALFELSKNAHFLTLYLSFKITGEKQTELRAKLMELDPIESVYIDFKGRKIMVERGMFFPPQLVFQSVFKVFLSFFTDEHTEMQFLPLNFLGSLPYSWKLRWFRNFRSQYS